VNRRDLLRLSAGASAGWWLQARAQQAPEAAASMPDAAASVPPPAAPASAAGPAVAVSAPEVPASAASAAAEAAPVEIAWADAPTGDALVDDLARRTFQFFWDTTDERTGLAPDRWPSPSFASVAAVGFALTAYPVGVDLGFVSREQARKRVLTTLQFLYELPQGPENAGTAGYKGFFYHFLHMEDGRRFGNTELSTVDTALLLAGALFCQSYFDNANPDEIRIRELAEALYTRVEWPWAQIRPPSIGHGWHPESDHIGNDWKGYNEAMLLYFLALGSPTHPVGPEAWQAWTSTYDLGSWGADYGQTLLRFAPLFGHQFTHTWVDFRGIQDVYMRNRGIDYFVNSQRATLAQQAYAVVNPMNWRGYGAHTWGITASDGPADVVESYGGRMRQFISYAGRGMGQYDDGTIAPYGAGSSIAFTPAIVIPTLEAMLRNYGKVIYGQYGFFDCFNLSFTYPDVKLIHGKLVPGFGWVDTDYLGIDQGPMIAMIGNYRRETVWKAMRRNPHIRRGLQRAGFTGGWLDG